MAAVACGGWSSALYPKWAPTQVSMSPQVEHVGELQSLSITHCALVVTEQLPGWAPGCPQSKIHRPMPTIRSPVPAQAHAGIEARLPLEVELEVVVAGGEPVG